MEEAIRMFLATGSGDGDGDGDGSGSGSGSCYGDGSGYGYGDGSGYGSGSGSGSGDSDGSGSGYGSGLESFDSHKVHVVDGIQTLIYGIRGNIAKAAMIGSDLVLQPCYVAKSGNFFAHGNSVREAVDAATAKAMQNMPVEERVALFKNAFPDNAAKYSATKFFQWHNTLTGSCSLGRETFMRDRGLSMDDSFTVAEFVELTKNHYGGDIIKRILP